ncbi:hypothetical protein EYF80_006541 [Liparis tanakae]|uniref:Uncharacterized protein n=1 Tax=Liparis tanakae TaxID=230148 RepID=A0A4Z2J0K9_9TELE|nr:hypothetical protein EYF80_006541 [Liparis tanakae]
MSIAADTNPNGFARFASDARRGSDWCSRRSEGGKPYATISNGQADTSVRCDGCHGGPEMEGRKEGRKRGRKEAEVMGARATITGGLRDDARGVHAFMGIMMPSRLGVMACWEQQRGEAEIAAEGARR